MKKLQRLPLDWKISASATVAMTVVLVAALGAVSVMIWHDQQAQSQRTLRGAASTAASLVQACDEATRKAAQRDFGYFRASFNAALVEQSAASAENLRGQAQALVQAVAVFKLN